MNLNIVECKIGTQKTAILKIRVKKKKDCWLLDMIKMFIALQGRGW